MNTLDTLYTIDTFLGESLNIEEAQTLYDQLKDLKKELWIFLSEVDLKIRLNTAADFLWDLGFIGMGYVDDKIVLEALFAIKLKIMKHIAMLLEKYPLDILPVQTLPIEP